MTDKKVSKRIPIESWNQLSSYVLSPHTKYTMVTMASYMTMCTVALVVISSVFCLFLFVTLVDDVLRIAAPHRVWTFTKNRFQLDWPFMVGKLSEQLTYLAEWEKQKRTSWYNHQQHQYNSFSGTSFATNQDDTFHDILFTITRYLNNYVHTHSKKV
ncbi:uncharacterized protein BX664DRAFT_319342 [Halteromyces radiatus]|uniref:uncharacterized protein n=1 Tax=Halteromyces radiatus TaxID=101107 RepID=UPI002220DB9A|nr:uncharacterized protein BX664DRAFT_319342 [Halteromyces radiatus]KAI8098686.1 hypothetical protein BX664DRAFT_319342 [Halteromyces radiatus]